MDEIKLQKGLPADAKAIRIEVFVDEQGFHEEFDGRDDRAYHAVLYRDGEPIATGRTFPSENASDEYVIGRLAVRKKWRGQGVGSRVLASLERRARACGATSTRLLSQVAARPFYEACGYTVCGEECMDEHCPHVPMRKALESDASM